MVRRLLLAGTVALAVGGCGTTVPVASQLSVSGTDNGASAPAQAAAGAAGQPGTGAAPGAGSPALGGAGVPATGVAAGPGAGSGATGVAQASGGPAVSVPGMTATTVDVGTVTVDTASLGAFAKAAGVNGAISDPTAAMNAVTSWVNAHGGLAGRRMRTVSYTYDVSKSESENDGAACALWTQDHHVFAGFPQGNVNDGGVACLKQHGVLSVSAADDPGSVDSFRQFAPYYYAPSALETVSLARQNVLGLHEHGFFTPGAKIGLIYFDFAEYRTAIEKGLKPALAQYGLKIDSSYAISYGGNAAELGAVSAAISNAQLRFAASGINHVLLLDKGGTIALFFMQQAHNQGMHYRYGLNSTSYTSFLAEQSGISDQLASSVVVGTLPTGDTQDLRYAPRNPARDLCFGILRKAGIVPQSAADAKTLAGLCATVFFLKAALDHASSFDPAGIGRAVAALGASPATAANSVRDHFGPGRPWGSSARGYLTYYDDCTCFRYGPTITNFL